MSAAPAPEPSRRVVVAVLTLIVAIFAIRNLPWHLDDYDQAKQAFVSFEMVKDGHWWFQHTPTGRIATKPPLAGWISAALFGAVRNWELAWRLPPFACALAMLVLLWRSGRQLGGEFAALLAVSAFALNLTAPRLATLVRTDMMLTLFIFIAGWLVLEKVRTTASWTPRDRLALGLAVLASMMTKGPILYAFLLPGLAIFAWLTWRRHRRSSRREEAHSLPEASMENGDSSRRPLRSGWLPWLAPLVVFAAWVGIGIWMSREFYEQVVLREFLGRFDLSDAPVHKHQPPYFYIAHLFGKLWAPWSAALLALGVWIYVSLRRVRKAARLRAALESAGAQNETASQFRGEAALECGAYARRFPHASACEWGTQPALLWLLCWALGGLVLMSLVPSKRPDRVFPIIPPLCLLLGVLGQRWIAERNSARRRGVALGVIALAAVISGGYAIFSIVDDSRHDSRALVHFGAEVQALTAAHPERLAIAGAKDEGLLLYTARTRFMPMDDAIESWRRGDLDWLVVREKDLRTYQEDFAGTAQLLEVPALRDKRSPYYLLGRHPRP